MTPAPQAGALGRPVGLVEQTTPTEATRGNESLAVNRRLAQLAPEAAGPCLLVGGWAAPPRGARWQPEEKTGAMRFQRLIGQGGAVSASV